MDKIINNLKKAIYYIIPIGLFIWCSQMIFNDSIWLDEAFSLSMISQGFIDIIKNTAIDVHPPLYYIILKSFTWGINFFLKDNIIWASKCFSMLPILLLIIISYKDISKIFGKRTAFLFNIFILGMPQIIKYAIEIRMYSLGLLFVTLFYISYIKWDKENTNKNLCKMTIYAALSAYTHYFAGVSVGCIYIIVLIELLIKKDYRRLKNIIYSLVFLFVSYLPWLVVLGKQIFVVKESYWIENITSDTIKEFLKYPYIVNSSSILTNIIKILLLITLIIIVLKRKDKYNKYCIFGFLVPIGTIVIGIIASKIIRPVFISRYMVCSLGCLWLAVAIRLSSTFTKKLIFYAITIILIITTICTKYKIIENENMYQKEKTKLTTYLDDIKSEEICMVFDSNQLQRIISYYYPNNETYVYKQEITQLTKQVYRQANMQIIEDIKKLDIKSKRTYVFAIGEDILNEITQNNYKYKKCGSYQIETYKFSIYQIV